MLSVFERSRGMLLSLRAFLRRPLFIGAVVLAFAAASGAAYAASQSSNNSRQAFLNDVAKRLNVSPQKLRSAINGALLDRLNAAVKAGKLTRAEANAIQQRIERGVPPFFGGPGMGFRGGRFAHPPGFVGPPGFFGVTRPFGHAGPLACAARYLGLTPSQLFNDLCSGRSLAEVAKANGKSAAGLERAMTAGIKSSLDAAAAAGRINKSQEAQLLRTLSARLRDSSTTSGYVQDR